MVGTVNRVSDPEVIPLSKLSTSLVNVSTRVLSSLRLDKAAEISFKIDSWLRTGRSAASYQENLHVLTMSIIESIIKIPRYSDPIPIDSLFPLVAAPSMKPELQKRIVKL